MKIVHLADLHLGYRAYNKLDKNGINLREKDILRAFNEAVEKIIKINPDLILIAGDIFHRPRPTNVTLYNSILLFQKLRSGCNAPIVMISGNHEAFKSYEAGSVLKIFETAIPGIKVVDGQIEQVPIKSLDTSILCVPYNTLGQFKSISLEPDTNYKYNIFMIHGSYESSKCPEISKHETTAIVKNSHIEESKWSYVALGHYHKFTELAPNTFYSGAIERTTSNIWQEAKQDKGFIEFDLDKKECRFHALSCLRKVIDIKKINADGLPSEQINEIIDRKVVSLIDLENLIIRLNLENVDPIALKELDYKKIRELKKKLVHFRFNLTKKSACSDNSSKLLGEGKKQNLIEILEQDLRDFDLSPSLNTQKFSDMAKQYLFM